MQLCDIDGKKETVAQILTDERHTQYVESSDIVETTYSYFVSTAIILLELIQDIY